MRPHLSEPIIKLTWPFHFHRNWFGRWSENVVVFTEKNVKYGEFSIYNFCVPIISVDYRRRDDFKEITLVVMVNAHIVFWKYSCLFFSENCSNATWNQMKIFRWIDKGELFFFTWNSDFSLRLMRLWSWNTMKNGKWQEKWMEERRNKRTFQLKLDEWRQERRWLVLKTQRKPEK